MENQWPMEKERIQMKITQKFEFHKYEKSFKKSFMTDLSGKLSLN